ncbi:Signal transduction histidine kinase [Cetobacterium ceti]|uniref:histidine kinase n=1 Tax=Cetobacterium ceti TaxID=180163 RepID=A0A1T4MQ81_9FUSO|nr:ATP-binding protein [Cetobacterium ceti]SJZ68976.1 Signal transduction histidine kinase [Cetobacterium ceti]
MKRNSIFFTLPLKLVLISLFFSSISYIFIGENLKKEYRNRILERVKSFAMNLEWTLYPLYEDKNYSTIQRLLEKQGTVSYVDTISIVNEDYYTVLSNKKNLIGRVKDKDFFKEIFIKKHLMNLYISPDYNIYKIVLPLKGSEYKLSSIEKSQTALYIEFDMKRENKTLYHIKDFMLITIFSTIMLSILLSLIILKRNVFNPLIFLQKGVSQLINGNYSYHITYKPKTYELKTIFRQFNIMIFKIKYTTEKLKISEKIALKSVEAKSNFLANMTHELRSPLNSIIGYSDILLEEEENFEKKKQLNAISLSSKHLLSVINDILNFSKLESKKQKLNLAPFKLEELISEIEALFSLESKRKNLDFIITKNFLKGKFYLGDFLKIKEVIINFLSNAFKFTSKGKVIFNITFKDDFLFVFVQDTGIGIPKDKINNLFKPFEQIEMTKTKSYGGTGLGLSISKEIIELMNGTIECNSELNKGSIFSFKIPLDTIENIEINNKEDVYFSESLTNIDKKDILIVDDMEDNQILTRLMLKKFNFDFDFANNGKEALEKILTKKYFLIFLDIQMPIMNGIEVLKILKEKNKLQYIIGLTAYSGEEEINEILLAGAKEVITKPLNKKLLQDRVNSLLKNL